MNFRFGSKVLVIALVKQHNNERDRLAEAGIWVDRDNNHVLIEQMDLDYVINLLGHLERKAKKRMGYLGGVIPAKTLMMSDPAYPHLQARLAHFAQQEQILNEDWEPVVPLESEYH